MNEGILKGNCLDIIDRFPNETIDACFADPPYGISYQSAWRTDRKDWKPKIENDEAPFTDWIAPLYKKMNGGGGRLLCFYRWDVQDEFLDAILSAGFNLKSQIVWDKMMHGMGDLLGEFAPQHELMIYATKGRYCFEGKRPKSIYRFQRLQGVDLIHPNEKPIKLMSALIRDLTTATDLIFDPFGGSFSTYLAAKKEGRKCISCELSDEYFKIGKKRVEHYQNRWLDGLKTSLKDDTDYSKIGMFATV